MVKRSSLKGLTPQRDLTYFSASKTSDTKAADALRASVFSGLIFGFIG